MFERVFMFSPLELKEATAILVISNELILSRNGQLLLFNQCKSYRMISLLRNKRLRGGCSAHPEKIGEVIAHLH